MSKDFFKKPVVIVAILILALVAIYFLFFNKSTRVFRKSSSNQRINCTSDAVCKVLLDRDDVECGANGICQYILKNPTRIQSVIVRPKKIAVETPPSKRG